MMMQQRSNNLPPLLYAKVFSKKSGRVDDLSVMSFADLSMYRAGSSMEDVVRKKQPVMHGPRNQRGRRPNITASEDSPTKLTYSVKLPSRFVNTLTLNATHDIDNDDSAAVKQLILEVKQGGCDLGKFRDVPCGVGLQEQMLGDYLPRPARIRGRPRKAEGFDEVGMIFSGENDEEVYSRDIHFIDAEGSTGNEEVLQEEHHVDAETSSGNEGADSFCNFQFQAMHMHGLQITLIICLFLVLMYYNACK